MYIQHTPQNVDQMLTGKQFNRAVRGVTIVYDVVVAMFFFPMVSK